MTTQSKAVLGVGSMLLSAWIGGWPLFIVAGLVWLGIWIACRRSRTSSQTYNPFTSAGERPRLKNVVSAALLGTDRPLGGDLPKDNVYFFGSQTSVDLGRGVLNDPLVYATGMAVRGTFDCSLIEGSVPVAPPGTVCHDPLPYWPSYYECSPSQRAMYLDWLLSGKKDPAIPIGYVFIYFYGLERRILVDRQDFEPIGRELIRLLTIYAAASNSFRRYATRLLWTAIALSGEGKGVSRDFLVQAINFTKPLDDEILPLYLGYMYQQNKLMPAGLAYVVGERDTRSPRSLLIKRHGKLFKDLFKTKYTERFGSGFKLQIAKQPLSIAYKPASATLIRRAREGRISLTLELPNVLGITRQFSPVVEIWSDCIEELKAFGKAHAQSDGQVMTTAMFEALPETLRSGDHPEMEAWSRLLKQYAHEDGKTLLPISALAHVKGFPAGDRLTKRQSVEILQTADLMGFGIEPDARLTAKSYEWDEPVALFLLEEEETPADASRYPAAATLLRLGLCVAQADGEVNRQELDQITQHLEKEFELSVNQTKRLEELEHLLLTTQSFGEALARNLQTALTLDQRRTVGRFLCGIAAADQVVSPEELKALKRLYRLLGIDPEEIHRWIAQTPVRVEPEPPLEIQAARASDQPGERIPTPPVASPSDGFVIDMAAVSKIMAETQEVAKILRNAMNVDAEPQIAPAPQPPPAPLAGLDVQVFSDSLTGYRPVNLAPGDLPHDGLDRRYQPFYQVLITRSRWVKADLDALARQQNLMLQGAIEAINEWSQEKFGDWLIEEGDAIQVRTDLLKG